MKHVNIHTPANFPLFSHHIDCEKYIDYDIKENSLEDIIWDCVVIYQNLKEEITFQCKKGNVLYFSGEPPLMRPCPRVFTNQFDTIILPHSRVGHPHKIASHGFLNWSRMYDGNIDRLRYNELAILEPHKNKNISIVTSNKAIMPGHNRRNIIIEKLKRDYHGFVDFYGWGVNPIELKEDALFPYRFHICMENSFIPDYWTEKFADPILAQSVPIYAGCTNIEKYFGNEGYFTFDINDYDSLRTILDYIIDNPENVYNQKKDALEKLRHRLMEEHNLIPFLINYMNNETGDGTIKRYHIKPLDSSIQYKMDKYMIRVQRLVRRSYFNLFKK